LALAEQGADVAVVDKTTALLDETMEKLRPLGGKAAAVAIDVRDVRQIQKGVAKAIKQLGGIDILVNNAGINRPARPWRCGSRNGTTISTPTSGAVSSWPRPSPRR
jgi:3-oxoacyl-[acyl-carrier protein] reductase